MLEQARKDIANDPDMDADERERVLKMMDSKAVKEGAKQADSHSREMETALKKEQKLTALPKPDPKRLAMLPTKTFSTQQLGQYLDNLAVKIQSQLNAADRSAVAKMATGSGSSAVLSTEAVAAWYNGNAQQALLLAVKAARLPGNTVALGNLGAMLIETGYEEKAVPLLQYARAHDSTNASVLNNLGRAYLGLGEKKKAKAMFLACVQHAPAHPEAHNSLGCLYEEEGNKEQAIQQFKKSIEGASNENAYEHLSRLDPDFDITLLVGKHHKAPEYFNQFGIEVPAECYSLDEQPRVMALHESFQKALDKLETDYSNKEASATEQQHDQLKDLQNTIMNNVMQGRGMKITVSPFIKIAGNVILRLGANYIKDTTRVKEAYAQDYNALIGEFNRDKNKTVDEYHAQYRYGTAGEFTGCLNFEEVNKRMCKALKSLADRYQQQAAELNTVFRQRYRRLLLDYFDEALYWGSLLALNQSGVSANFYQTVYNFLKELEYLSESTPFMEHFCEEQVKVQAPELDYEANKQPFCPFTVSIPFVVGKMSFDCTSFSLSGGEGVKMEYKKDFTNGQTTLSIGAGISADIGVGAMGADAGVDESIYVTFNGDGQPTDAGMKTEIGANIHAGNVSTGVNAGYTVGMNSGWDFSAGGLGESFHL